MSATGVTLAGRRAAEALMVDTCTITRVTGGTSDPETGVHTQTTTVVYSGKCRFQQRPIARPGSRTDVGEASVVQVDYSLQLPMAATGVRVEDAAVADTSALDPDLPGRAFRVASQAAKTHATSRRLELVEVNS
jgi:hypothetical protein